MFHTQTDVVKNHRELFDCSWLISIKVVKGERIFVDQLGSWHRTGSSGKRFMGFLNAILDYQKKKAH